MIINFDFKMHDCLLENLLMIIHYTFAIIESKTAARSISHKLIIFNLQFIVFCHTIPRVFCHDDVIA